jgi:carbon storage regulator CsrA
MLVLTRKEGTSLTFQVGQIEFTVSVQSVSGNRTQLAIDAPGEVRVRRSELPPLAVIPQESMPPDVRAAA